MAEAVALAASHAPAPATPYPIAAHRLVGGGRSAALLRPDGEVDWWCAPDPDSPPVLWSLLDPVRGTSARWLDARMVRASEDPAGPTARTTLALLGNGRRFTCWDGVLELDGSVVLARLVRGEDGNVEVTHEVGGVTSSLVAPAGRWAGLVVGPGPSVRPADERVETLLEEAERAAAAAMEHVRLPKLHPGRAADALAVLRACTYEPTGAVVAAVTTSLPEAPGAGRQWDYRFSWLRDASLAVSVAALLGQKTGAERYLRFVRRIVDGHGVPGVPVTDVRGGEVPAEREVPGLRGWAGSQPVRVGNEAAGQLQYDSLGLVLEAISVHVQAGGSLDDDTWATVRRVAGGMVDHGDPGPSSGIWELRDERPLVSADVGRWLALDRALWIARGWRAWDALADRRRWKRERDRSRERVLAALGEDGSLPQWYGQDPPVPDASALMIPMFGMLGRSDPRAARLVDWVVSRLEAWPFLYRYPPGSDGLDGREGAFLPVSWWAAGALAAVGRLDEAGERVDAMCARLPRLLAEEVDPVDGAGLGNVPLVWSHAEAARTMYLLDAARRRKRWGATGLWVWRLGRYASMRWGRS
ncbi:MAG: glycoside hydrolase family 15 protein [Acidimicrobiia bacterium]